MVGCRDRGRAWLSLSLGVTLQELGPRQVRGAGIRVTEDTRLPSEMPSKEQMGRYTLASFFHIPPPTNAKSSQEPGGPKV